MSFKYENQYGLVVEKIRQSEVNDVFKATYRGMETFLTFPRSMEMTAEDAAQHLKPEDFIEQDELSA